MLVIVGLGNPGEEYLHTRHNAGWMFVDEVVRAWQLPALSEQRRCHARISKSPDVLLIEPTTFMNNSGQAVKESLAYYDLPTGDPLSHVIVAHDDLDLSLGSYKLQFGTGPKVHNGLLSLYKHLKTQNFWHLRIGVDGRAGDRSMPGSAYVLQQFASEEKEKLTDVFSRALTQIETLKTTVNEKH